MLFMSKLFGFIQLQVFSLPFSFVVILFLYFLHLRTNPNKLQLTTIQNYSPEVNLYLFKNSKERLSNLIYFPIYLPFWGDWNVTQGHNGSHTHKGEWGHAYDFMLRDEESKTYSGNGLLCEDFYCYNKPILAPADGIVEEIIDHIDDNEIGKVNTTNNWGNTIIIRHLSGLYTQLSHLKKGSFKVTKGDSVRQGDLIALCGNSGRSPEPHVHFQIQTSPILGARTLDYPLAYFHKKEGAISALQQFERPKQDDLVSSIMPNKLIKSAFDILPNSTLNFQYTNENGNHSTEQWDSYTDAYNNKYLYCQETESTAFYVNDGSMFYFTSFIGNKKSLLYYFYLSAYKVFMGELNNAQLTDVMPLNTIQNKKIALWLHDFIAPFHNYMSVVYSVKLSGSNLPFNTDELTLESQVALSVFSKLEQKSKSTITLKENRIQAFNYQSDKIKIEATCINI